MRCGDDCDKLRQQANSTCDRCKKKSAYKAQLRKNHKKEIMNKTKNKNAHVIGGKERPLSWSQISSFEYDKEAWYDKYILKKKPEETEALRFGKQVGERLETDQSFLTQIPRDGVMEHPMKAKFGNVWLVGYADCYRKTPPRLDEYKSGKKPWDKKRVDEHGQLTLYCLLEYLLSGTKPEDTEIWLHWMPTKENGDFSVTFNGNDFEHFQTTRTMKDILEFGMRINKTVKEMYEYVDKKTCLEQESVLHLESANNN